MKHTLIISAMCALLVGCSGSRIDYEGCGGRLLQWTYGPDSEQFLDVCYVDLNITAMDKVFVTAGTEHKNPDTGRPVDMNKDGISDTGPLGPGRKYRDRIRWGGNSCQQFARRVSQKGCQSIGNNQQTAGCDWIAINIEPRPGVESGYVSLTPMWRVRLPNGQEQTVAARTFTTGFNTKDCR
ncbi:MAG: hypothetical protein AAF512_13095 [Pseudomonadota bacterium]